MTCTARHQRTAFDSDRRGFASAGSQRSTFVLVLAAASLLMACAADDESSDDIGVTETGYARPTGASDTYLMWAGYVDGLPSATPQEFEASCLENLSLRWDEQASYWGCDMGPNNGGFELVRRSDGEYADATFTFHFGSTETPEDCGWIGPDMELQWDQIELGLAGLASGHFVDLGSEVAYDGITWESLNETELFSDEDLSALHYWMDRPEPAVIRRSVDVVVGNTYVIRFTDVVREQFAKLRVLAATETGYQFEFDLLHRTPNADLCARLADGYTDWYENERNVESGQVTLYDRSVWGDYIKATFNVAFATRDHGNLVGNTWDLIYERGELRGFDWREDDNNNDELTIAQINGVGMSEVALSTASELEFTRSISAVVGAVYYVRTHVYGHDAELVVEVVSLAEGEITLDWRRLSADVN